MNEKLHEAYIRAIRAHMRAGLTAECSVVARIERHAGSSCSVSDEPFNVTITDIDKWADEAEKQIGRQVSGDVTVGSLYLQEVRIAKAHYGFWTYKARMKMKL